VVLAQSAEEVRDVCGENPTLICRQVFEWTGSDAWAEAADRFLVPPLHILLIVVVAYVANRLVRRSIRRLTNRIVDSSANGTLGTLRNHAPGALLRTGPVSVRAAARAQTLGMVLRSIATTIIWTIAAIMILGELGVALGPLIAGAGIAGVALGFGAQSLVKDFLSGIFMLIEDQYGVGDIVDAGVATGTVEDVTLRATQLRDVSGTVWYIPNGTILRVGNMSQEWSRAVLDVDVTHDTDLARALGAVKAVVDELWEDPEWSARILEEPEVLGVERIAPTGITIRTLVKTRPAEQFKVMREMRRRVCDSFQELDIQMPGPPG
jgi:moderate conductance mechanosensitive channel